MNYDRCGFVAEPVLLSIGAQMIGRGDVEVRGVVPSEMALPPDMFFVELAKRGIKIHERVEG